MSEQPPVVVVLRDNPASPGEIRRGLLRAWWELQKAKVRGWARRMG
jgi:hypothetical protein